MRHHAHFDVLLHPSSHFPPGVGGSGTAAVQSCASIRTSMTWPEPQGQHRRVNDAAMLTDSPSCSSDKRVWRGGGGGWDAGGHLPHSSVSQQDHHT